MSTVLFSTSLNESQCGSFQFLSSEKLNNSQLKYAFPLSFFATKQRSRFLRKHESPWRILSKVSGRKKRITRSLYSPFVESLKSSSQKAGNSYFQAMQLATEKNVKLLDPSSAPCETVSFAPSTRSVFTKQVDSQDVFSPVSTEDTVHSARTEPLSYVKEDSSCSDVGQNLDARKQPYWGAPSMSLSIGSSVASRRATYTMAAIGPAIGPARMKGVAGTFMVLTVAALGITKALFNHFQVPQKSCPNCHGHGVEQCDFCNGRGEIKWEGKLKHSDPCPLCFGSRVRKCNLCCGRRFAK